MSSDIDIKYMSSVIPLSEIEEDQLKAMVKEGDAYHTTPQDLASSVEGFTDLWSGKGGNKMNSSPIQLMFAKFVNVYKYSDDLAYSLCEHYVRVKVFALVMQAARK